MFTRILIANRGEIAVRIARACAQMGIKSVGVYSDADRTALHVRACDESYHIGPAPAAESYLRSDKIIEVALKAGCEAIHPGYGFLSENAAFARAVTDAELVWIGPSPEAIELMGSKIESKRLAEKLGVPTVPGYSGDDQSTQTLVAEAKRVGYPILVKASAGGGGKGMRVVEAPADLPEAIAAAQRESFAAFGDDSVLLEKYLSEPRHIEVQVLGDHHGNLIHLGERECSIQRRHQKVLEESPSPIVTEELRARITSSALALARAAGYTNAGTVEFIYQDGEYYFLEMNTRLQVEHPVTEEAIDIDLVEEQIKIAAGEKLSLEQEDAEFVGCAIEVRLYAEDPERGFLPSTGRITALDIPYVDKSVLRIDSGVTQGDSITPYYDPMIAKIIASGDTRQDAIRAMQEALSGLGVEGVATNLDFLRWLVSHPQFEMGNLSTRFIESYYRPGAYALAPIQVVLAGAALRLLAAESFRYGDEDPDIWSAVPWRQARQRLTTSLMVEGHKYDVTLSNLVEPPNRWQATVMQADSILYEGAVEVELPNGTGDGHTDYQFAGFDPRVQLQLAGNNSLYSIEFDPRYGPDEFSLIWEGRSYWIRTAPALSTENLNTDVHLANEDTLESPMPGKVLKVMVKKGDNVTEEQPLIIIEAMKMEFTVKAPHGGKVAHLHYQEGAQVAVGDVLLELEK